MSEKRDSASFPDKETKKKMKLDISSSSGSAPDVNKKEMPLMLALSLSLSLSLSLNLFLVAKKWWKIKNHATLIMTSLFVVYFFVSFIFSHQPNT